MLDKPANTTFGQNHKASLLERYHGIRAQSVKLAENLSDGDQTVQSMSDASPTKWHLAHTTWFFETFIIREFDSGYKCFDDGYSYLFNSYYETFGKRQPRPERGLLTRPSADEILAYRQHVDAAISDLIATISDTHEDTLFTRLELGCRHEQQHQELLLTDILHLFAQNPLKPTYHAPQVTSPTTQVSPLGWVEFEGGIVQIGHEGTGFAFDNETPRHDILLQPYKLADRCVTNADWLNFINDGGYRTHNLWLADGWTIVNQEGWQAAAYWEQHESEWLSMTLGGLKPLDMSAPVAPVSYYEADAYARWANARLPSEFEWENAASCLDISGNMAGSGVLQPQAAQPENGQGLKQMFGDVWEWTRSAYSAYPGFSASADAIGEYNGKFMSGQFILRGGSCATPEGHVTETYRNFFYPHQRWQFSGLRLAKDI